MRMFKTLLVAALSGLIVGTVSTALAGPPTKIPPAPAHDAKTFTGTMCQQYQGTPDTLWYQTNSVVNRGETPARLTCPVVRDDATGTDGVYMARVTVADSDPNADVVCTFHAFDKWGMEVASVSDQTYGTPGKQILDLDLDQSAEYGTYALVCDLPFNGVLYAYRIYEHQDGYDNMTDYDN